MTKYLALSLLLLTACAVETPTDDLSDLSQDDAVEEDGAKADGWGETSTYYLARRDIRRCAYPFCGGSWVHRANYATTRCADGTHASECYVADIDVSALDVSDELGSEIASAFGGGQALLRGSIRRGTGSRPAHAFVATEAYRAATDAPPSGVFYRLNDNGRRCFAAPCFSIHQAKLNSYTDREISSVDFEGVGAEAAALDRASTQLAEGNLFASGLTYLVFRAGPAGTGITFEASQLYLPFEEPARACGGRAGNTCSDTEYCAFEPGEICGFADAEATCETRPIGCPKNLLPVCGCDNVTYGNACMANAAGTGVKSEGECEVVVPSGCFANSDCAEGEYCALASCGTTGEPGTCTAKPESCTREFEPVCGCDEQNYNNPCQAAWNGVSVSRAGDCVPMSDCRTTGCDEGSRCQICWSRYACVPDGAVC